MNTSLYIHIPFCRKKCGYCDFYSTPYDESLAGAYIDALCGQIRGLNDEFSSIYLGGGTPTVLSVPLLQKLLLSLKPLLRAGQEFTVEANPESLDAGRLTLLRDRGVNRVSIGFQSFSDEKLRKLGRVHSARLAIEAVRACAERGFTNIGIDLIYGVWGETIGDWQRELESAVALPLAHISVYSLTYEKGTPLYARLTKKTIVPIEDAVGGRMYEYAYAFLKRRGFIRYEVSNFARRGFYSRHNSHYWSNEPYVGLGPSAASYINGDRQKNIGNVQKYIARVRRGDSVVARHERLGASDAARETAAVKIRTVEGIDFAWFKRRTGFDFRALEERAIPALLRDGLVRLRRGGVSLTDKGFLFCDTVSAAFL